MVSSNDEVVVNVFWITSPLAIDAEVLDSVFEFSLENSVFRFSIVTLALEPAEPLSRG